MMSENTARVFGDSNCLDQVVKLSFYPRPDTVRAYVGPTEAYNLAVREGFVFRSVFQRLLAHWHKHAWRVRDSCPDNMSRQFYQERSDVAMCAQSVSGI